MAALLQDHGKLAEVEPLQLEALEATRRTLGDERPETPISISNMASSPEHWQSSLEPNGNHVFHNWIKLLQRLHSIKTMAPEVHLLLQFQSEVGDFKRKGRKVGEEEKEESMALVQLNGQRPFNSFGRGD